MIRTNRGLCVFSLPCPVRETVRILSDTELNYTEVIERWADRSPIYGSPEHFYVLARMEKRRTESVLRRIK